MIPGIWRSGNGKIMETAKKDQWLPGVGGGKWVSDAQF